MKACLLFAVHPSAQPEVRSDHEGAERLLRAARRARGRRHVHRRHPQPRRRRTHLLLRDYHTSEITFVNGNSLGISDTFFQAPAQLY